MANRALDWFLQAKRDYEKATLDWKHGFYEWCYLTAQQAGEKAIKALYYRNNQSAQRHSLVHMLEGLASLVTVPEELYHYARILDRYPNGFPEGSPFEFFDEAIAKEALHAARAILEFCENHLR